MGPTDLNVALGFVESAAGLLSDVSSPIDARLARRRRGNHKVLESELLAPIPGSSDAKPQRPGIGRAKYEVRRRAQTEQAPHHLLAACRGWQLLKPTVSRGRRYLE